MNQQRKSTKEFAAEAVALLYSSGRTRRQVADDLGIGLSTLARWSRDSRDCGPDVSSNEDIVSELKRLRRENDVLRQERDILKKATVFFAKEGRSRIPMIRGIMGTARDEVSLRVLPCPRHGAMLGIDQAKNESPVQRLCKVLCAKHSWKGCGGSPRMTRELQDDGFAIGRRRTARLMRENGMQARQKRRFKRIEGPLESAVEGTGDRLYRDLALAALRKAIIIRCPAKGLIHHSDRGSSQIYADCVNLPAILLYRLPS